MTTNGYGALYSAGEFTGFPGTFTYSLSHGQIRYVTNDSPRLTGTLRHDPTNDILIYQESAEVAKAMKESGEPLVLHRDTDEKLGAMLDFMIGAASYKEVMTRLGQFLDSITNHPERFQTNSPAQEDAKQDGAANWTQPSSSDTNPPSPAASSRR